MYEATGKADEDDDLMDAFTDDMDVKSAGMILKALDHEQAGVVRRCGREILWAVRGLGGSRGAYKRERKVATNRIVSEVYSPPRVASAAKLLPDGDRRG